MYRIRVPIDGGHHDLYLTKMVSAKCLRNLVLKRMSTATDAEYIVLYQVHRTLGLVAELPHMAHWYVSRNYYAKHPELGDVTITVTQIDTLN